MKRTSILIAIQFMAIAALVAFGLNQRSIARAAEKEASTQRAIALKSMTLAEEARQEAENQRKMAELNAREAMRQAEAARRQAEKCK